MSDLDPRLERAFATARAERPHSSEGRARTLAALGVAGAAARVSSSLDTTTLAPEAAKLLGWPWWTVALALLATFGDTNEWRFDEPPPSTQIAPVASTPAAERASPSNTELASGAASVSVDDLPNAVVTRRPSSTACASCNTPPPAPRAPAGPSTSLRDEIDALEQASRALSLRQCLVAEQRLAAYRAKFPAGRLQSEAEVIAIEITGRSGHVDRARADANRFVARFPNSPYELRLAPWLAGESSAVRCADAAQ